MCPEVRVCPHLEDVTLYRTTISHEQITTLLYFIVFFQEDSPAIIFDSDQTESGNNHLYVYLRPPQGLPLCWVPHLSCFRILLKSCYVKWIQENSFTRFFLGNKINLATMPLCPDCGLWEHSSCHVFSCQWFPTPLIPSTCGNTQLRS